MTEIEDHIRTLNVVQVAEAMKNLRVALQHKWGEKVEEPEVREALKLAQPAGEAAVLRDAVLSGTNSGDAVERWGRSLLLFAAADPELRPDLEEAIEDAEQSSAKDFGLTSLIVLGAIVVLLKWRPKKIAVSNQKTEIDWVDNDVSVVSDLATAVSGVPVNPPKKKK